MVSTSTASETPPEKYERLVDWVKQGEGGLVGGVRVTTGLDDSKERGLFACDSVSEGEVIVRIPQTHVITARRAKAEQFIRSIMEATERDGISEQMPDTGSDSAALILFLLREMSKKRESFWASWFETLPSRFVTLLTLSDDQMDGDFMEVLDGTPALPFVYQLRAELKEMYDCWFIPYALSKHANLFDPKVCDYQGFLYAHAIMESRAFKLADRDDILLVPLADMTNHDFARRNTQIRGWTLNDDGDATQKTEIEKTQTRDCIGLELIASTALQRGQELKISYGALTNWELLVHFGFALRHNPHDDVIVQIDPEDIQPDDDAQCDMKRMIALHLHVPDFANGFSISVQHPLPQDLVTGARIMHASDAELDNAAKRDYSVCVSERNERAVIQWLRMIIDNLTPPEQEEESEEESEGEGEDETTEGSDRRKNEQEDLKRLKKYCATYVESMMDIVNKARDAVDELKAK